MLQSGTRTGLNAQRQTDSNFDNRGIGQGVARDRLPVRPSRLRRLLPDLLQGVHDAKPRNSPRRIGGARSLLRCLWQARRFLGTKAQALDTAAASLIVA